MKVSQGFTLLLTYKVLKQRHGCIHHVCRFTLLLTYKVLKRLFLNALKALRFTLLLTYKVLKPRELFKTSANVLHSY